MHKNSYKKAEKDNLGRDKNEAEKDGCLYNKKRYKKFFEVTR